MALKTIENLTEKFEIATAVSICFLFCLIDNCISEKNYINICKEAMQSFHFFICMCPV